MELPGVMAGPCLPPARRESMLATTRPPEAVAFEWQPEQFFSRRVRSGEDWAESVAASSTKPQSVWRFMVDWAETTPKLSN